MRGNTHDATLWRLDRLVGVWSITGDASGAAAFRWNNDGSSLIQEATLDIYGAQLVYTQVITQQHREGDLETVARLYTIAGHTIDHIVEIHDNIITAVPAAPRNPPWSVLLSPDNRSYTCQWKDATAQREILAIKDDGEESR